MVCGQRTDTMRKDDDHQFNRSLVINSKSLGKRTQLSTMDPLECRPILDHSHVLRMFALFHVRTDLRSYTQTYVWTSLSKLMTTYDRWTWWVNKLEKWIKYMISDIIVTMAPWTIPQMHTSMLYAILQNLSWFILQSCRIAYIMTFAIPHQQSILL